MEQHRYRDVIGQVGHQSGGLPQLARLNGERILFHDRKTVSKIGCPRGHGIRQFASQTRVNFHGRYVRNFPQQPQSQRTQPGAHLHHAVLWGQIGSSDDAADGVRVMQKVLAQLLRRRHVKLSGEFADLHWAQQMGLSHTTQTNTRGS